MSTTARTYLPTSRKIGLDIIRYRVGRALVPFLLMLGLLVTLMPFLWTILSSFKTQTEIIRVPPTFWPENPTLDNYRTILQDENLPVLRFYANSTIVAVCNVLSTLFTSALLGFLFAKYEFRGKRVFFGWFMLGMMIPGVVTMIPDYMILVKLRLANKLAGLIVLSALDAFGIFMMRQFIETIPNELLDAARIDGASEGICVDRLLLCSRSLSYSSLVLRPQRSRPGSVSPIGRPSKTFSTSCSGPGPSASARRPTTWWS